MDFPYFHSCSFLSYAFLASPELSHDLSHSLTGYLAQQLVSYN